MRRRGVAGAIRNCLILSEFHDWATSNKIDLLTALIYPLADHSFKFKETEKKEIPKFLLNLPEKKKTEPDLMCRKFLLESLFLLSKNRKVNELMRSFNFYSFVRELDTLEENEDNKEIIVDIVNYLILDWEEKSNSNQIVSKNDDYSIENNLQIDENNHNQSQSSNQDSKEEGNTEEKQNQEQQIENK